MSSTSIQFQKDAMTGDVRFEINLSASDMVSLRLDAFDRMTLDDCGGPEATPADWLLALEIIFRRMGEQNIR